MGTVVIPMAVTDMAILMARPLHPFRLLRPRLRNPCLMGAVLANNRKSRHTAFAPAFPSRHHSRFG